MGSPHKIGMIMTTNERSMDPTRDLPRAKELLPILWHIIDRWHEAETGIKDWENAVRAVQPEHTGWAGYAELLQLINTFQWHEEDRSHAYEAGDEILASVKRSIDASNARRVKTIDALDVHIWQALQTAGLPNPDAPLHSESPASIVDRISILALKLYHIREELSTAGGTSAEEVLHERVEGISQQMDDLALCIDQLFADIAAGRRRMKLYRQVKVYMDPKTGRYHSGLTDSGPRPTVNGTES